MDLNETICFCADVTAGDIIIVLPGHLHAIREISGQKMEYEKSV